MRSDHKEIPARIAQDDESFCVITFMFCVKRCTFLVPLLLCLSRLRTHFLVSIIFMSFVSVDTGYFAP